MLRGDEQHEFEHPEISENMDTISIRYELGQESVQCGALVSYPDPSHFHTAGCVCTGDAIHPAMRKWEGSAWVRDYVVLSYNQAAINPKLI